MGWIWTKNAYQVEKGKKDILERGKNSCKDAEMFISRMQVKI